MRAKLKWVTLLALAWVLFCYIPALRYIWITPPESAFRKTEAGIYVRQGDPVASDGVDAVSPGKEAEQELVRLSDQPPKYHDMSELPEIMQKGIPAVEDAWLGYLPGINPWRLGVATWHYFTGGDREGGGTLHMQTVRELYLTKEKTLWRKFQELNYAFALWTRKSWRDVLSLYTSYVAMGSRGGMVLRGDYEAAVAWYELVPMRLQIDQMAVIAGMHQAPSRFNPGNPDDCKVRRDIVLGIWLKAKVINQDQYNVAIGRPIKASPYKNGAKSFASAKVEQEARRILSSQGGKGELKGLQIFSTIDKDLQKRAENAIASQAGAITKYLHTDDWEASLVLVRVKTGEVLAYVGGRDYAESQLDHADPPVPPQTGSAFKPFVVAAALETHDEISLATLLPNGKGLAFRFPGFKDYAVENSGSVYSDTITLRQALVLSENVPHVALESMVGLSDALSVARKAGLKVDGVPSDVLGVASNSTLKVAEAYTSFARGGSKTNLTFVRKIFQNGQQIYGFEQRPTTVMSPQTAFLVTSALLDVIDHGTGKPVRGAGFKGVAAFKTGSSTSGWAAGYTEDLVGLVNVTFNRPADHNTAKIFGASTAGLIWGAFFASVEHAHPNYIRSNFKVPAGIERVKCTLPGGEVTEYVREGKGCGGTVQTVQIAASPSPSPTPTATPEEAVLEQVATPAPEAVKPPEAPPASAPTLAPSPSPRPKSSPEILRVPEAKKSGADIDWFAQPDPTPAPKVRPRP